MKKICSDCKIEKPVTDFYKKSKHGTATRDKCKVCSRKDLQNWHANNREKTRQSTNEWRAKNPEKVAAQERKKRYGITQEQYDFLKSVQGNKCGCCGDEFVDTPHIDHEHGVFPIQIRGLLCKDCNLGLGRFKDSPARLHRAIEYLRKNSS